VFCGCSNTELDTDKNYYPGPKGEPPKAMEAAYKKQFFAEEKNYFFAVGEMHSFLLENSLHPVYKECLTNVLDIRVRSNTDKPAFPCVLVSASTGDGAPLRYIYFSVDDVKFNQLDRNNRLIYTIGIYGYKETCRKCDYYNTSDLVDYFSKNVEPKLIGLYRSPSQTQ
jgi:hypothetical protein